MRKSYKSQHENTKKHRAAVQNDAQVQERRRKYLDERHEQTERVVEILGKLTITDKRFIVKNQFLFMECLNLG
jgi:flagellar biosynthesis/type III secretory pathway chaperone